MTNYNNNFRTAMPKTSPFPLFNLFNHPCPIPVELIDGSSAAPITHFYHTNIRIHGSPSEDITLQLVTLAHFSLVLGFPWLARHNPTIDWAAGNLTFDSPLCLSSCLFPPVSPPPPVRQHLSRRAMLIKKHIHTLNKHSRKTHEY